MYRALKVLDAGQHGIIERGSITALEWLKPPIRVRMVRCGAVAEISPPPLDVLPGWTLRAKKLAPHGITNVTELLQAGTDELAEKLGYKPRTIKKWKDEAITFIVVDEPPTRRG